MAERSAPLLVPFDPGRFLVDGLVFGVEVLVDGAVVVDARATPLGRARCERSPAGLWVVLEDDGPESSPFVVTSVPELGVPRPLLLV